MKVNYVNDLMLGCDNLKQKIKNILKVGPLLLFAHFIVMFDVWRMISHNVLYYFHTTLRVYPKLEVQNFFLDIINVQNYKLLNSLCSVPFII